MSQTKNRLEHSASAYLRSAAHQPIDWHEWGDEAFARAKSEDKPILLDIGAVWCHWCHVIDRESYENAETARIINEHFVAVKVDRDERPDVDARYQAAISALSGQGGWPLTGFLTPDGRPFFGGTYFPPDDAFGRPGFKRILLTMADVYRNRRGDVEQSASVLAKAVAEAEVFADARGALDPGCVAAIVDSTVRNFDLRNGGFGRAPKFPHPTALDLLMAQYANSPEAHLHTVIETTLAKMARGGVYDQLAGGFHRYSVDERWCVPHFEKMSYDNSELLKNYTHAWQLTQNPLFRETAESIIGWVNSTLSDQAHGGFYASQDADYSLEDDGDYFTWKVDEVRAACSPDEARAIELHYDVEAHGEMHHNPAKNVLWIRREAAEIAHLVEKNESDVRLLLASAKGNLLAARGRRPAPFIDTTIYTGWNGMFCSAYLEAGRALGGELGAHCVAFALKTLDRILREAWDDARGFSHRVGPPGAPRLDGTLDDFAFTAAGLLDAYEATLDHRWFEAAERAMVFALEHFRDREGGGFFDRGDFAAPLGGLDVRRKPLQDSPTPAANAIAAIVLNRLHAFTGRALYRECAQQTLEAFSVIAPQMGMFAASYGLAMMMHASNTPQVVVFGASGNPQSSEMEAAALQIFRFGKSVLRVTPETQAAVALPAALQETVPHLKAAEPQALVCLGKTCFPPVRDALALRALLEDSAAQRAAN